MENLEEVLQALDEFQKTRPTEIPRELEDYLCWVAKTGDPVYQWSTIKVLFREKLTRVMTDFYESCPTLELAPCPNVEHFNYDTMKSNLLERLEAFANAPFTVQRICELLTAPRKEYNRVDKFMRAIEKNILVVSTREPGPIGRRGETGDGMMNGSVDEDAASVTQPPQPLSQQPQPLSQQQLLAPSSSPPSSPTQPPQPTQPTQPTQPIQPTSPDIDMEYWEKDCTATVTISVQNVENGSTLLHTAVPAAAPANKNALAEAETPQERETLEDSELSSRLDIPAANFISGASDFSNISNLTSQVQPHESLTATPAVPAVEGATTAQSSDDSSSAAAVTTESVTSENIDPQLSLDLTNEVEATTTAVTTTTTTATAATTTTATAESTDSMRKLQTAFQTKHLDTDENKCLKIYTDNSNQEVPSTIIANVEEEIVHNVKTEETTSTGPKRECIDSDETSCNRSTLNEDLLKTDIEMKSDELVNDAEIITDDKIVKKSEVERMSVHEDTHEESLKMDEDIKTTIFTESHIMEKSSIVTSNKCTVIASNGIALHNVDDTDTQLKSIPVTISAKENSINDQSTINQTDSIESTDKDSESIPNLESSKNEENRQDIKHSEFKAESLKTMEVSSDDTILVKSILSDSISTVETSKETTPVIPKLDTISPVIQTDTTSDNSILNVTHQAAEDDKSISIKADSLTNTQGDKLTMCDRLKGNQSSAIENFPCKRKYESMEIDDEESVPTLQQDEQMEQETMEELSKS